MRCDQCSGRGVVRRWILLPNGDMLRDVPCRDCGGTGVLHCCEGMQEHPPSGKEVSR
jgi:DnaJ-class molecular chaperone